MGALAALMPIFTKILDFIPDPNQRAIQLQELITALQTWDQSQNQVNQAEAASSSVFVAGWRPFIGWCCGVALFYQYLIIPFITWGLLVSHVTFPPFPTLDDNLWQLMFGMLGLGGLRTFEKLKGVA